MREIKFRAWRAGKMVNVDVLAISEVSWSSGEGIGVSISFQPHIPVMQFTGLKDKNGKEIYEGDIVKEGKKKLEVFWNSRGSGQWWFLDKKCHVSKVSPGQLEVIGNIYENPELVKSDG